MEKKENRIDIQALRGYAVTIVVLFHAKLDWLPSGYLGVDVFFVISGYLITRMIKESIERNNFRFSDFYFRRAKRLLPATYVTLLAITAVAPFFLASPELRDLRAQTIGAVTFTGNLVLWSQSGYFSGAAELKPLLHIWSLAIEEQYYFLLPGLLVLVPKRFWMLAIGGLLLCSLALCFIFAGHDASFYLLPTRAWELLVGSVGALLVPSMIRDKCTQILFWPALLTLLVIPFLAIYQPHPGLAALVVCSATLALLLRNHPGQNKQAVVRGLSRIGDISYSLYLVHWPIFALFNNAWIGRTGHDEPLSLRLGLTLLSLALAWLLNRYVEEPVRRADIRRTTRVIARTLGGSFAIVALNIGVAHAVTETRGQLDWRQPNYGLAPECAVEGAFQPRKECRTSESPHLLVWGDSFAMHLIPGLVNEAQQPSIMQATRPVCGPFIGFAVVREHGGRPRSWAESCIAFNNAVLDYLRHSDSIRTVVLSSPLDYLVNPSDHLLRQNPDGSYTLTETGLTNALAAFDATVKAVRAAGKRVVLVAPPPMSGFDSARCNSRLKSKLPVYGADAECAIDLVDYQRERADVLKLITSLPTAENLSVIRFDKVLCNDQHCITTIDGMNLYRDPGHLSQEGSRLLAARIGLLDTIVREAK